MKLVIKLAWIVYFIIAFPFGIAWYALCVFIFGGGLAIQGLVPVVEMWWDELKEKVGE